MPAQDAAPIVGLSEASADETKSIPTPLNITDQAGGTLEWGDGCTAGKVVWEIAPRLDYTGIWEVKFSSDFVADSVATEFGTPPCVQSFTYPGPYSGFGRWRIATAIVGGTVSSDTQRISGE